jgi:hypothetical protein
MRFAGKRAMDDLAIRREPNVTGGLTTRPDKRIENGSTGKRDGFCRLLTK